MKFMFKTLIITILLSLNAFADNPDHYPKLNDLIDTVGKKGEFEVKVPKESALGKRITANIKNGKNEAYLELDNIEENDTQYVITYNTDDRSQHINPIRLENSNYEVGYYGYKEITKVRVTFKSNMMDDLDNQLREMTVSKLLAEGYVKYSYWDSTVYWISDMYENSMYMPIFDNTFKGDSYIKDNKVVTIETSGFLGTWIWITVANKDYDRITRETIETLDKAKREEDVNSFKKMF